MNTFFVISCTSCEMAAAARFFLSFTSFRSRPHGSTSGQSTQALSNCRSQEKQMSVRWTWSCLFSYQPQVIDYKLTGSEHSVPGRCGRQDYSCHKCPVMQQSHKHFFFFFAAQSQWKAPLLNTPPPLLKPNACHSPYPHQPPAFLHVHKPTHVNTKHRAAHKAMDTWDTQLTINSDLFMSDRSHEVVKRSPAYGCFGFYAN